MKKIFAANDSIKLLIDFTIIISFLLIYFLLLYDALSNVITMFLQLKYIILAFCYFIG